jgi:hypothetical protein
MLRRFLLLVVPSLFLFASTAMAQGTHQFLGPPREVADRVTPKHNIRYNTQGYDEPLAKWKKKVRTWQDNSTPQPIIDQMLAFPGSPDAIAQWIDDAFDQTLAQFTACGGALADRASRVSASDLTVTIMPSAFIDPFYKVLVAGAYYPGPKEIKVLNIYYIWEGPNTGWLRHSRDLLVYEMQNYFAVACGIVPEPRTSAWPCDAPLVVKPQ